MNACVLLLDDDEDLRSAIAEWIDHFGRGQPLELGSVAALAEAREAALACEVALLDVNLGPGQPTGIDALKWLRDNGFRGRIAFLTGHAASLPLLRDQGVPILSKPLGSSELLQFLDGPEERAA
jgi:FixJ family two-component response regulator